MTNEEKIKFIESAISKLSRKEVKVKPTDILADMNIDSMDIIEMQMWYDDEFNTVSAEPTGPIITVLDLMNIMAT